MSHELNDSNKLRCVIYARSATGNANDLQRQIQACHAYILERPNLVLHGSMWTDLDRGALPIDPNSAPCWMPRSKCREVLIV